MNIFHKKCATCFYYLSHLMTNFLSHCKVKQTVLYRVFIKNAAMPITLRLLVLRVLYIYWAAINSNFIRKPNPK